MRRLALIAAACVLGTFTAGAALAQPRPSVEARLRAVEDRLALEALLSQYVKALDERDWAAYAALFTEDGVLTSRFRTTQGRTAIRDSLSATMTRAFAQPGAAGPRQHNVNTMTFQIDGDRATGLSHWQVIAIAPDGKPIVTEAGHYADIFRRVQGRWLFERREIVDDIPRVEAAPRPAAP